MDHLINTRGTADKNVHKLEKSKRQLEQELNEQKTQLEEHEDELQQEIRRSSNKTKAIQCSKVVYEISKVSESCELRKQLE